MNAIYKSSLVLGWCILLLQGCTVNLKLTDNSAPFVRADLEADYELSRFGGEKQGLAPTPPQVKASGKDIQGIGLRVRGKFSNNFFWTNPEGSSETTIATPWGTIGEKEELTANGWGYWGRLLVMPGLTLWGDRIFLAGVTGLSGLYMHLPVYRKSTSTLALGESDAGTFGITLGGHLEWTIARTIAPSCTITWTPDLAHSGNPWLSKNSVWTTELGVRLWPGSLIPTVGDHLWIEAGYTWLSLNTAAITGLINETTHIDMNGPSAGFGFRF